MQFIVDEPTGVAVIEYLRAAGYRVLAIGESMPQAVDKEILERAESEGISLLQTTKISENLSFAAVWLIMVCCCSGFAMRGRPIESMW
jgi:superfamily II DNA/RNA helicase